MEEKLLALLKAKFSGEREDGLNLLASTIVMQVNTEEEANSAVEALTKEKVSSFIANWRRLADSELTKATKTTEATLRKQFDFVEKKTTTTTTDPVTNPTNPDNSAEVLEKLLQKHLTPLQQELEALKKGKSTESRTKALEEALKEANPAFRELQLKTFSKMSFETEDDFTNYLGEVKTDSEKFTQELTNQGLLNNGVPWSSNNPNSKQASDAECDKLAENLV